MQTVIFSISMQTIVAVLPPQISIYTAAGTLYHHNQLQLIFTFAHLNSISAVFSTPDTLKLNQCSLQYPKHTVETAFTSTDSIYIYLIIFTNINAVVQIVTFYIYIGADNRTSTNGKKMCRQLLSSQTYKQSVDITYRSDI